ncbi:recombinase family protein [Erythrobacter sp. R86502]|uniref:recombinase family protein n=1 Tax=Erythrobacter sp. R86502 TaxID=3093846 RepID=UPI0036D3AC21
MTTPAYIYARYSSLEQGKGTSLKRQLDGARSFIKLHNEWDYPFDDPQTQLERDFTDQGKSAYAGTHREPGGALYDLERKANAGHFRNGAVLVVENLDRLTRQGWEEALKILTNLTMAGISVHTIQGSKVWSAGQKPDMGQVITVIVEAEADHRASDDKSKRVQQAWNQKIEAMVAGDRKAHSKHLPGWLEIDPKTGCAVANTHRAELVIEIYELYVEGMGLPAIVRSINSRGEPSWAYGKRASDGWNTAYLHKLLKNRAVLGEFSPKSRKHGQDSHHAVSKGIVIPDYYPQIISADLFNKAQAAKALRSFSGGAEQVRLRNLFAGLATCSECGSKMYYQLEQRRGRPTKHRTKAGEERVYTCRTERSSYRCNSNRRSAGCSNSSRIRYEALESTILDVLLNSALDNRSFALPDRIAEIEQVIAERERITEHKRAQVANLVANLTARFSEALANQLGDLEDEIRADESATAALRTELAGVSGSATPEQHLARVRSVRGSLNSDDPDERYSARMKVQHALRGVITQMTCYPDKRTYIHSSLFSLRINGDGTHAVIDAIEQANEHRTQLPADVLAQLQRIEQNQTP